MPVFALKSGQSHAGAVLRSRSGGNRNGRHPSGDADFQSGAGGVLSRDLQFHMRRTDLEQLLGHDVLGELWRVALAAQVRQTFINLGRALAAAGALPKQVAKITIYVVDYRLDYHYPIIDNARATLFGDHKPANVVVGVAALSPDYLLEVDAVAVIDD